MLRNLLQDIKECPATMALSTGWVLVFALMLLGRLAEPPLPSIGQVLLGNLPGAHRFGDLTLRELALGESWRVVTCTFVHYSLLHIALNLCAFYQLGCLIESWYGSGQSLAIYVLIGGGGNVLSSLIRRGLGSDPAVHSGGGSTVVLGMVALCAVVGWRSKTRFGDYLRSQMVRSLVLIAVLGQILPIIDNWGHAGGALVGAAIGFAHRGLVRTAHRRVALAAGVFGILVLVVSGLSQVRQNRREDVVLAATARLKQAEGLYVALYEVRNVYLLALQRGEFARARFVPRDLLRAPRRPTSDRRTVVVPLLDWTDATFRALLGRDLAILDAAKAQLSSPTTESDYREVRALLADCVQRSPTRSRAQRFETHWKALVLRAERDIARARLGRDSLVRGGRRA